mgnify:CR=1 FL=1
MLRRLRAPMALLLAAGALTAGALAATVGPAAADGGTCDRTQNPWCTIDDGTNGGNGGTNGGGGGGGCAWDGQPIACQDPEFGAYIGGGCYWRALRPPPATPPPQGKDPAKGAWGVRSCYNDPSLGSVTQTYVWMDTAALGPTPAELAQQALAKLHLLGARIGVAPDPAGAGAVGLPVWLWTAVTPETWGPQSASASTGAITVSITAKASHIVWTMGDGQSVTCANPGTAYETRFGNSPSPTCGYRYTTASSTAAHPRGRYTVTATTGWTVAWAGGGQSGVLTPTSQSQTSVEIGEIQVVGQ